jgi:hypothetical protein
MPVVGESGFFLARKPVKRRHAHYEQRLMLGAVTRYRSLYRTAGEETRLESVCLFWVLALSLGNHGFLFFITNETSGLTHSGRPCQRRVTNSSLVCHDRFDCLCPNRADTCHGKLSCPLWVVMTNLGSCHRSKLSCPL